MLLGHKPQTNLTHVWVVVRIDSGVLNALPIGKVHYAGCTRNISYTMLMVMGTVLSA